MKQLLKQIAKILNKDVVIFVFVFSVLIAVYNFQHTSFIPPQGLHQWRQCVGAAYAMNYYNYDLDITEAHIYNHISSQATSDVTFAECPILYFLVAILYKLLGNDDSIFRIFNALILIIGLFYLFKGTKILLGDKFWSLFLPVLLFTSPTLVYYGNSFLPDTTAFGIVFIALFNIIKYYKTKKIRFIYFASLFYTIAGLLKVTSLISLFAISGSFILFFVFSKSFRKEYKILSFILPMIIPAIMVFLWYYFVHFFNTNFGGAISPVTIRPIWELDAEVISKTWHRIGNEWINSYFHSSTLIVALIVIIITLIFFKKTNRFLILFIILNLLGSTIFFFMFFRSLYAHDYYLINVFIVVVLILFNGLMLLKHYYPNLYSSKILKIFIVLILAYYAYEARVRVDSKFNGCYNNLHIKYYNGYVGLEKINRENGINKMDLVISIPDNSINISLYLMNQPGFTDYGFINKKGKKRIEFFISKGAKYLFVNDTTIYNKQEYQFLKHFTKNKLLRHKNIDIYDLRRYEINNDRPNSGS